MRQEQLAAIRQKCIEANPTIKDDTLCTPECRVHRRPIRLADILLAAARNSVLEGWQYMVDVCGDFYALPDGNNPQLKAHWNLRADNLEDQSDETIAFIHSLLV